MPGIGTTVLVSAYAARFNPPLLRAQSVASRWDYGCYWR
ncbi:Uncharacterised protein [Mycobacteroides abscessus subsp. bolletii]|nr:Uncharacterised protein [Mycobacteroides abscessus subsp. bolletii]SKP59791.1 Uncharacterised protein [Mycobacteroides abscessus subsp. bolletii]SKP78505.1 Uncharacterised protein [Mycobacteroides abscessus subsp. bolletii]SKQ17821.1 Uncharacterised protein [Mycobacteroides abscessus subsp. bolletii]